MHARRTGISRALSDTRTSERVRSIPLVWAPREPKPQAEGRAGSAAHWPGEETAVPSTIQTSQALPGMRIQARHTQDPLCSGSRRATSTRSSSPAAAERTDSRMTCSVLCISRVSLDRTVGFEPARACAASLHSVAAVGHLGLFVRLFARSYYREFLLYPYNDGGAVQLHTEAGTARLRPGGRAASERQKQDGVTPPASRASHAGRRRAASASARGPWPRSLACWPLARPTKEMTHGT
jgi:hypothetical protein